MIEAEDVDHLSLNKLSESLSVKTPSLYRYFKSKTALLRAINEETTYLLFKQLYTALDADGTASQRLMNAAHAYRQFAHAHPATYGLVFTNTIAELRPDEQQNEQAVLPVQAVMAQISGETDSLPALRGLLALIHGFVMLELAQQYRRGGDLDAAFEASVRAYLRGWAK
jgi:AcrR family transcriptional regulator